MFDHFSIINLIFAAGKTTLGESSVAVFENSKYETNNKVLTPKKVTALFNNDSKGRYYKINIILNDNKTIEKSFGTISKVTYLPLLYSNFNDIGADLIIEFNDDNSKLTLAV